MRRRKRKKQRKIIIISLISLLFIMTIGYAAFNANLNITVKANLKEKPKIIKRYTKESTTDFHEEIYRENIVTATFLNTNQVPNNAIKSWDVSQAQDKGVMAYIKTNASDNTKYDLYIGANKGVVANENSGSLFYEFTNLTTVNFNNNFDTSNAISIDNMFAGGNSITTLDLSTFDTTNVTEFTGLFSGWHSSKGIWAKRSITKIIFGPKFTTNKAISLADMFSGQPLTELDLRNFDTSNVMNFYHMFNSCTSLKTINLCSFNTKNATNMSEMFKQTINLTQVKVGPNWITTNANTTNMWNGSKISQVTTGEC